jgi:hypothetical protein
MTGSGCITSRVSREERRRTARSARAFARQLDGLAANLPLDRIAAESVKAYLAAVAARGRSTDAAKGGA